MNNGRSGSMGSVAFFVIGVVFLTVGLNNAAFLAVGAVFLALGVVFLVSNRSRRP